MTMILLYTSSIHPRPKRQIGERLALGAFPIAYDIHDMGIFKGPLPTSIENEGSHFVVTYDSGNADLNIRENPRNIGFQVIFIFILWLTILSLSARGPTLDVKI